MREERVHEEEGASFNPESQADGEPSDGTAKEALGVKVREHSRIKLVDGRVVRIADVLEPGIAYIAEMPTPDGPSRYEDFTVTHDEVAEVLPYDYPMVDPYSQRECRPRHSAKLHRTRIWNQAFRKGGSTMPQAGGARRLLARQACLSAVHATSSA